LNSWKLHFIAVRTFSSSFFVNKDVIVRQLKFSYKERNVKIFNGIILSAYDGMVMFGYLKSSGRDDTLNTWKVDESIDFLDSLKSLRRE